MARVEVKSVRFYDGGCGDYHAVEILRGGQETTIRVYPDNFASQHPEICAAIRDFEEKRRKENGHA